MQCRRTRREQIHPQRAEDAVAVTSQSDRVLGARPAPPQSTLLLHTQTPGNKSSLFLGLAGWVCQTEAEEGRHAARKMTALAGVVVRAIYHPQTACPRQSPAAVGGRGGGEDGTGTASDRREAKGFAPSESWSSGFLSYREAITFLFPSLVMFTGNMLFLSSSIRLGGSSKPKDGPLVSRDCRNRTARRGKRS